MARVRVRQRVLIIADTGFSYGQSLLRGAVSYLKPRLHDMRVSTAGVTVTEDAERFMGAETLGVIAQLSNPRMCKLLEQANRPVVNVSTSLAETPFPSVCVDDEHAGETAARHLAERGLRSAIFLGQSDRAFSQHRLAGVRRVLGDGHVQLLVSSYEVDEIGSGLRDALREAERPVGIIGSSDQLARRACDIAVELGLLVSVDVVVAGINDDAMVCELNWPTLTSVMLPFEQVGARAAAMLLELMDGREPEQRHVRLPALGVAQRQSSGLDAIPDPHLRAAVAVAERTLGTSTVADMLAATPITQRRLEQLFRRHFGKTPHQYLMGRRAARARQLVVESNIPITTIALECGFSGPSHMGMVFRKLFDATASELRRAHQPA